MGDYLFGLDSQRQLTSLKLVGEGVN